jgi:alkanesulfonate monooxygenase SsuD/methylene tetrahydromethanopterin reductase-like flavin-dependent oxidoreductase (luciferase family)
MGGPKASRIAAHPVFDGAAMPNLTTPEAHGRSIEQTLEECERIGRDPSTLHFISPVTTAPGVDEERLRALIGVRIFIYLQLPQLGEMLRKVNGWDLETANRIRNENPYAHLRERVDSAFQREELVEMTKRVPEEWMREAAAVGTVEECVSQLQRYRDAGAHEIDIYSGPPAENAELARAWRAHTSRMQAIA